MAKSFVPATDEVWRLQNSDSPDCVFFRKISQHGHYARNKSSQQGIYICSPSGQFLASINSTRPDQVLAMMKRGLEAWNKLDAKDRKLPSTSKIKPDFRYISRLPKDGLVLAMYARDLPEDLDPKSTRARKWNRDNVWFSQKEAATMVPKAPDVGRTYIIPKKITSRLVALHMTDTVKGQTDPFEPDELITQEIEAKVTKMDGDKITIEMQGKTKASSTQTGFNRSRRGVTTQLLGNAVYDMEKKAFTHFEMVAVGRRWGYTRFNFRRSRSREDVGNSNDGIGFVFTLAPKNELPTVPAFIYKYDASWLR